MTQIAETVNRFLDNDFVIRTCLFQNITSLRALARHIIQNQKLSDKNLDAVISAIRRYKRDNKFSQAQKSKVFKNVGIRTKDNVVDMYLPKKKEVQQKLNLLNDSIDYEKGDILRVIQAEQGIRVIIDEKNVDSVKNIFSKKELLSVTKNLAEVIIQFTPNAVNTLGIISMVSSSLTAADIAIHEIMSSAPELIVIVDTKKLIDALTILNNLKEHY